MAISVIAGGLAIGILILVMGLVTRGREPRWRRAGSDGGFAWTSDGSHGGDGCDSGSSDGGCSDGGGGDGGGGGD